MDYETARYIINYFSHLLTAAERLAIKQSASVHQHKQGAADNSNLTQVYKEKGWLRPGDTIGDKLKGGYEEFELNVAGRILSENAGKIYFNNCPKCDKLARTPFAKQCRHCGHSWHALTVAQFRLHSAFQVTGRQFFILGEVIKGEIKQGQFMDLTMFGLSKRPRIEIIEFALNRQDDHLAEHVALGTSELTEAEKYFINGENLPVKIFDIINER